MTRPDPASEPPPPPPGPARPPAAAQPATPAMPATPAERAALEAGRERAIKLLTDRFADDTLTVEEFEARLDRMYQAATPADLDALTSDLVGTPGQPLAAPGGAWGAQGALAPRQGGAPARGYPAPGETLTPAWTHGASPRPVQLPVYHSWRFRTSALEGDFQALAHAVQP